MKNINIPVILSLKEKVNWLLVNYPRSYFNLLEFNLSVKPIADEIRLKLPLLNSSFFNWATRCYWIIHDMADFPKCSVCGKAITRNVYSIKTGYNQHNCSILHCSKTCITLDNAAKLKRKETCLKKYGVDSFSKTQDFVEKRNDTFSKRLKEDPGFAEKIAEKNRQTRYAKYGGKYCSEESNEKRVESRLKTGNGKYLSDEQKQKMIETSRQKYGTDFYLQTDEFRERSKQTCLEKYGVEYSFASENNKLKSVETNLKKYGHEHAFSFGSNEFKENLLNKYGDEAFNNPEKIKKTCLEKYGSENYFGSDEMRRKHKTREKLHLNTLKAVNTKIRNGTTNTSGPEESAYKVLCGKFGEENVVRQYKSERYPFFCDFYIRHIDVFIELNLHWTHGKTPFDPNDKNHILILNEWQKRAQKSKFYKIAVGVWTVNDPQKMKIAKENNLHFMTFYEYADFESWLNSFN